MERLARELWAMGMSECRVCPAEGSECEGPIQGHHVIAKQTLKRHGLHLHLWDVRNRLPVCEHRHAQHTNASKPIPREFVSAAAWEFAAEVGLEWWLDRFYPSEAALDTDDCVAVVSWEELA